MANKRLNIEIGARFGRLTVTETAGKDASGKYLYKCMCDCGAEKIVNGTSLKGGSIVSCGCAKAERAKNLRGFHGQTKTRLYYVWSGMLQRCRNEKSRAYKNYGARGIKVCDDWDDFRTFHKWAMANGYADGLSIERIDVDGNYCPDNCTFIPMAHQCRNKQNTIRYKGECLATVCAREGKNYQSVHSRVSKLGWSVGRAVETEITPKEGMKNGRI